MPTPRVPDHLRELRRLDPAKPRPDAGQGPPRRPPSLSKDARPVWAYYVKCFPALRPADRDVLAVFCEAVVMVRDLQAALADLAPGSVEAMRVRRDLKTLMAEVRSYSDRLGFNPKTRERMTMPDAEGDPDLEEWMQ